MQYFFCIELHVASPGSFGTTLPSGEGSEHKQAALQGGFADYLLFIHLSPLEQSVHRTADESRQQAFGFFQVIFPAF